MPDSDSDTEELPTEADRRAPLEHLRAVGQTFTDGVAALHGRVANYNEDRPLLNCASNLKDAVSIPLEGAIDPQSHVIRLSSLLDASEARGDAIQEEAARLRVENKTLEQAADRSARLLASLRVEYDRLRENSSSETVKESSAVAEVTRLRVQLVEFERELQRISAKAETAERKYAEERQKKAALERVCMGLRRRVAISEEKAQDGYRVQEALLARETAEAHLAEARAEAERWRAKCSATGVLRERAEAAERSEHSLREKVSALEKEIESREGILRHDLVEKRRLKEFMANYERELEEKEVKLAKLRRVVHRKGNGKEVRLEEEDERGAASDDETDLGSGPSLSMDKDIIGDVNLLVRDQTFFLSNLYSLKSLFNSILICSLFFLYHFVSQTTGRLGSRLDCTFYWLPRQTSNSG